MKILRFAVRMIYRDCISKLYLNLIQAMMRTGGLGRFFKQ